jgi:uncharacterized protein YlxP (DUF503 family)
MMVVGICAGELHLPSARSLKDKRRVVKSLVERIHQRHRVSVAETDFHDLHQRAEIGVAVVGRSETEVEELMDHVRGVLDNEVEAMLTHWQPQILTEGR